MKKYNNADTTLAGNLQASGTSFVVKTGEGALFPADGFPYDLTLEHYEGTIVTKREIMSISNKTGDAFTIAARHSQSCVQDESQDPKTRTANALSFSSGDRVYMTVTETDINEIPETYSSKVQLQNQSLIGDVSTGSSNAYILTLSPAISNYSALQRFVFKANFTNTGTATLNVNGKGAKTIKKLGGTTDLIAGDIQNGQTVSVQYDGVNFQIDTPLGQQAAAELPGVIKAYAGTSAPAGYLICNGSAISRTTYADLFAVIGTVFGIGDGSTTFNIPNLKGKVIVGVDSAQTEFDVLGETGGEKTHLLTSAESGIPAHTHTAQGYGNSGGTGFYRNDYGVNAVATATTNANTAANAASAHNNLQPYMSLNYIIKY